MTRRYRRGRFRARASKKGFGMSFGKFGLNITPSMLAGVAIGMTNLDEKLPQGAVLAAAVAPVRGIGVIKGAAQGVVLGNLLQGFLGGRSLGEHASGFGI